MVEERTRRLSGFVTRYGIFYPGIATGCSYLASTILAASFEIILFTVFAIAAVLTGFSAMSGPSSNDPVHAQGGFFGTVDAGENWGITAIVKLILFDIGMAMVLTIYTFA
ncbi:hypothetical protein [Haladaptatus sp. CMAA 1911]|uniref:hypothetical protein n=1 Tax=unclassified Haladaptatus TaxID=2622732 RepID=UPI003754BFB6